MKPERIAYFESLLLDAQAQNLGVADLLEHSGTNVALDQTKVGRISRMDAMQQQAMSQASDRRREEGLIAIREALERIDEGIYGECVECMENITEARLEIDPAIAMCIKCTELNGG